MTTVLALNAGSSTFKYTAYRFDATSEIEIVSEKLETKSARIPLDTVLARLSRLAIDAPAVVAHRIVHGGRTFSEPVRVDDAVLAQLDELTELAPLHLPPALELLKQAREGFPRAVHVACFDTAFHASLPDVARRFAISAELYHAGVRRYGFHGLSCEYVLSVLGSPAPARLVVAHLGGGASLTAIQSGRSIDTSMGLTPTGGVPMGTRSGDLDPGVLFHLAREKRCSLQELEHLVNHDAGLKGMAGSADMGELVRRASAGDAAACGAIELFAYAIKKQLGAYIAVLGGLDCLVFTGGIGEHVPLVRKLVCQNMAGLGIELDDERNAGNAPVMQRDASACQIRIIAANEDLVMARAAHSLAVRVQGSSRS